MNSVTTVKHKKHLSFDALRQSLSSHLLNIPDHRQSASCTHRLHDAVMSGFACKYPSKINLTLQENFIL